MVSFSSLATGFDLFNTPICYTSYMSDIATHALRMQERDFVQAINSRHPELLERPSTPDPDTILKTIGVTYLAPDRPRGYIRLYPQDFLVEEILLDGTIVRLDAASPFENAQDQRTLWVDLVKANLSGPHAMLDLQDGLGVALGQLGYAGIKDAVAVTSQRLSLRGVTREAAERLQHPNFFLRPVRYGSGAIQAGELRGNRFTIVIRTEQRAAIDEAIERIKAQGCINFFGSQRFGPRLIAHRLGQKLLQQDVDGAVRLFLSEAGIYDVPLYRDLRLALGECYGAWPRALELARRFPFTLRDEICVMQSLSQAPHKTRQALGLIQAQVKLWIYAYGSWLINRRLSEALVANQSLPAELALPLSSHGPLPEYQELMRRDGTLGYLEALKYFPYVRPSDKKIQTRITPQDFLWKQIPQGWIVRFALGKGAYATACLAHVFSLYELTPVPEWVQGGEIDALRDMGDGSIAPLHARFASVLLRRDVRSEDSENTEAA